MTVSSVELEAAFSRAACFKTGIDIFMCYGSLKLGLLAAGLKQLDTTSETKCQNPRVNATVKENSNEPACSVSLYKEGWLIQGRQFKAAFVFISFSEQLTAVPHYYAVGIHDRK